MFNKVVVFSGLVCLSGYAFAEMPQVVTSEVFDDYGQETVEYVQDTYAVPEVVQEEIPVWPIPGSEADVEISCDGVMSCEDDTKIVTNVGHDIIIENNINTGGNVGTGWSGGPNVSNTMVIPEGFDYECANSAEMPLMRREMMEDDGGSVLAVSRSSRKVCGGVNDGDSYAMFARRAGFAPEKSTVVMNEFGEEINVNIDEYVEDESAVYMQDEVRSWVVASGQTLREVLQSWCDRAGWDLVWTTAREYPIEASAVFKGRFMDVASALIRNFERATPIPYAKFYKGNRVVVVSTAEE